VPEACRELVSAITTCTRRFVPFASRGVVRFEPWARPYVRLADELRGSDIPWSAMSRSQGGRRPMTWKGRNVFKTVFDFALYPMMIAEIRPRTIIELGSGDGGSAVWLRDTARMLGVSCKILSFDVSPPRLACRGVRFLRADANDVETLGAARLRAQLHPWIVLEDCHVNTSGILRFFHDLLEVGDYLVVEDSAEKIEPEILAFDRAHGRSYRVDTRYTDFFGRNATCAIDCIFAKVSP
jgi:cephalosporin hydroxylase